MRFYFSYDAFLLLKMGSIVRECYSRNSAVTRSVITRIQFIWKKLIKIGWWSGWWVGECFFWYRLTWVIPDKGLWGGRSWWVSSVVCLSVSLCRGLDQKLKLLLDDASHYIRPQTSLPDTSDEPFDRFADKKQITDFLQNACENCITK